MHCVYVAPKQPQCIAFFLQMIISMEGVSKLYFYGIVTVRVYQNREKGSGAATLGLIVAWSVR